MGAGRGDWPVLKHQENQDCQGRKVMNTRPAIWAIWLEICDKGAAGICVWGSNIIGTVPRPSSQRAPGFSPTFS
jgi:hypothetical protein